MLERSGTFLQYRLFLYPPGTNQRERVLLWFPACQGWVGAMAGIGTLLLLGDVIPPSSLLTLVVLIYVVGISTGMILTRRLRPQIRRLTATVSHGHELQHDNDKAQLIPGDYC